MLKDKTSHLLTEDQIVLNEPHVKRQALPVPNKTTTFS